MVMDSRRSEVMEGSRERSQRLPVDFSLSDEGRVQVRMTCNGRRSPAGLWFEGSSLIPRSVSASMGVLAFMGVSSFMGVSALMGVLALMGVSRLMGVSLLVGVSVLMDVPNSSFTACSFNPDFTSVSSPVLKKVICLTMHPRFHTLVLKQFNPSLSFLSPFRLSSI